MSSRTASPLNDDSSTGPLHGGVSGLNAVGQIIAARKKTRQASGRNPHRGRSFRKVFEFTITQRAANTRARLGRFTTPHGIIETPVFIPVGTRGAVKGLTPAQLADAGTNLLLVNTYHLALRPGAEIVRRLGGLHRFMGWIGPLLTDSGGFQVFSLASLTDTDDDGVTFKSHIDGAALRLTPAKAVRIQEQLGADIIMVLDECPALPADATVLESAVRRTVRWAEKCKRAQRRSDQAMFGIVQGGLDLDLRRRCLDALVDMDFAGYALGGLSVGEGPEAMTAFVRGFAGRFPEEKPRYLMGVGRPIDILRAVAAGIDMFDCVMPTRNGRNAFAFTDDGFLRLRNARHQLDDRPLEPDCDCHTCNYFSRAYLRHLFLADEMLGPILVSLHNIAYYHRWMRRIREAVAAGTLAEMLSEWERRTKRTRNHDEDVE